MTVMKVAQAIIAELKAITRGVLLMRKPEKKPSAVATKMPASPP